MARSWVAVLFTRLGGYQGIRALVLMLSASPLHLFSYPSLHCFFVFFHIALHSCVCDCVIGAFDDLASRNHKLLAGIVLWVGHIVELDPWAHVVS